MKVQRKATVKAKCVAKMLSSDGAGGEGWECTRDWGMGSGPEAGRQALPSLRQSKGGRERPDFLSPCWNVLASGDSRKTSKGFNTMCKYRVVSGWGGPHHA